MIQKRYIKELPMAKLVVRDTDSDILDLSVKAEEGIKISLSCGHIVIVSKDVMDDMKSDNNFSGNITYLGNSMYCINFQAEKADIKINKSFTFFKDLVYNISNVFFTFVHLKEKEILIIKNKEKNYEKDGFYLQFR